MKFKPDFIIKKKEILTTLTCATVQIRTIVNIVMARRSTKL